MVRLAKFNENSFIDSAIDVAAQCGVGAVSMAAIAVKAGAPIGSVYHRFDSRNTILARAWLRVKGDFRQEVASLWRGGDTWAGVHGLLDWCRRKPVYARFLLQCEDSADFNGGLARMRPRWKRSRLNSMPVSRAAPQPCPPPEPDLEHMC